ncbi:MAG: chloride channel protein [Acidimicrobiia bacterium]
MLAAITGALTGLAVVAFEWVTVDVLLEHVRELPDGILIVIPAAGLIAAWVTLRWLGAGATPAVADEYLREYHGHPGRSDVRAFAARIVASMATLGSGGAMGFEGPSIYLGSSIGARLQTRYQRFFTDKDTHVLLVAGAAAGVAAIFKAPATGAVFALEVPYQQDTASHAVLPALIGSAASYLVFAAFKGTSPLLHIAGNPGFDARDLLGALALGVACGIGARGFARLAARAKRFRGTAPAWLTVGIGGLGLVAIGAVALGAFGEALTVGPGYQAISWSLDPGRATELVALLLVLEAVATLATLVGGGVGGLFIPLVVQGWLLGRVVEGVVGTGTSLFAVVGAAAYLGAGYRTPIAAVVFVTEASRGPGFIVPALLATAVAQLLMGTASVASHQLVERGDYPTSSVPRSDEPNGGDDVS